MAGAPAAIFDQKVDVPVVSKAEQSHVRSWVSDTPRIAFHREHLFLSNSSLQHLVSSMPCSQS